MSCFFFLNTLKYTFKSDLCNNVKLVLLLSTLSLYLYFLIKCHVVNKYTYSDVLFDVY